MIRPGSILRNRHTREIRVVVSISDSTWVTNSGDPITPELHNQWEDQGTTGRYTFMVFFGAALTLLHPAISAGFLGLIGLRLISIFKCHES